MGSRLGPGASAPRLWRHRADNHDIDGPESGRQYPRTAARPQLRWGLHAHSITATFPCEAGEMVRRVRFKKAKLQPRFAAFTSASGAPTAPARVTLGASETKDGPPASRNDVRWQRPHLFSRAAPKRWAPNRAFM